MRSTDIRGQTDGEWSRSGYSQSDHLPAEATEATEIFSLSDETLTNQAKTGDRAAFGELVRRHRTKACRWAKAIALDEYAVEDIVQEALVRAFLRVGTLTDPQRFLPWFHRIVRNQALMKVRRGGPFAKEMPFASWEGHNRKTNTADASGEPWRDVEQVLHQFSLSIDRREKEATDPAECLLRKEMFESIRSLLHCLGPKERNVFEAFFFQHLTPSDIADLFHTSTANVYNHLANSRRKVKQERLRVHVGLYVDNRRQIGLPRARILSPPPFKIKEW
jgi:RNA polymerase sigma factor (sigma-70 family)